jgi:hypothetical protein
MHKSVSKPGLAVALGSLMLMGVAGCSMFSPTNTPVDCNLVKTQQAAGKSDAQIATDLGAKASEVTACASGPETSGNKTSGTSIPQSY